MADDYEKQHRYHCCISVTNRMDINAGHLKKISFELFSSKKFQSIIVIYYYCLCRVMFALIQKKKKIKKIKRISFKNATFRITRNKSFTR